MGSLTQHIFDVITGQTLQFRIDDSFRFHRPKKRNDFHIYFSFFLCSVPFLYVFFLQGISYSFEIYAYWNIMCVCAKLSVRWKLESLSEIEIAVRLIQHTQINLHIILSGSIKDVISSNKSCGEGQGKSARPNGKTRTKSNEHFESYTDDHYFKSSQFTNEKKNSIKLNETIPCNQIASLLSARFHIAKFDFVWYHKHSTQWADE